MSRCIACNTQINFGDDLCRKCEIAVGAVYKPTQEDVSMIEAILYRNTQPSIVEGIYEDVEVTTDEAATFME